MKVILLPNLDTIILKDDKLYNVVVKNYRVFEESDGSYSFCEDILPNLFVTDPWIIQFNKKHLTYFYNSRDGIRNSKTYEKHFHKNEIEKILIKNYKDNKNTKNFLDSLEFEMSANVDEGSYCATLVHVNECHVLKEFKSETKELNESTNQNISFKRYVLDSNNQKFSLLPNQDISTFDIPTFDSKIYDKDGKTYLDTITLERN